MASAIPKPRVDDRLHTFSKDGGVHEYGTTTTEAGEAIPSEVYSDLLLEALYAAGDLRDVVSATTVDLTGRAGDTVSVLSMPSRSPSTVSEGSAVSDSADDPTETTISLTKWGDMNVVTREVLEDSAVIDRNAYVANLMGGMADQVDARIASQLDGATAGSTASLDTAGNLSDLYERIVDVKQAMKASNADPDTVVLHPDQEAQLLKDTREGILTQNIQVQNGGVTAIAGMEVIVTSHWNASDTASGTNQAAVLDTDRAMAEVWGRRPDAIIDETTNADTDEVRLIVWMRYETDVVDTTSVGFVQNP